MHRILTIFSQAIEPISYRLFRRSSINTWAWYNSVFLPETFWIITRLIYRKTPGNKGFKIKGLSNIKY